MSAKTNNVGKIKVVIDEQEKYFAPEDIKDAIIAIYDMFHVLDDYVTNGKKNYYEWILDPVHEQVASQSTFLYLVVQTLEGKAKYNKNKGGK